MFDLTGQQVLLRFLAGLVIIGLHGLFVAGLAVSMGDRGPRYDGRLSVNPLRHIEPIGALTFVVFRIGWIKPVAVDIAELRNATVGVLVIVLGSLLLMIAVAEVLWLLRPTIITSLPDVSAVQTLSVWIDTAATMAVWFAVVNLIPVPPLTGGLLLALIAPSLYRVLMKHILYIAIGMAVLVFTGAAATVLDPAVEAARAVFLR